MSCSESQPESKNIIVREVWNCNVEQELSLIQQCVREFSFASFDTKFPGSIFTTPIAFSKLSPTQHYDLMRKNVNSLKLIQMGLTLSDIHGNLPTFGTPNRYLWQFNFHGFNPRRDPHDPQALTLLTNRGMDFDKNEAMGINPRFFAQKFRELGLGHGSGLKWITFHGIYDYGYLIRILTGRQLPDSYEEFTKTKESIFGRISYDTRDMGKQWGLHGGLDKIAKILNVERAVGQDHQAGSDSLLSMHLFLRLARLRVSAPNDLSSN